MGFLIVMFSAASWPFRQPSNEMVEKEAGFSQGVSPRGPHFSWLKNNPGVVAAEEAVEVLGKGRRNIKGSYTAPPRQCDALPISQRPHMWTFPALTSPLYFLLDPYQEKTGPPIY